MRDEAAGGQRLQLLTIHRGLEANVETCAGLAIGEAGHDGAHRDMRFRLGRDLFGQQPSEEGRLGELLGTGLLQQGLHALLDPKELEVLEMFAKAQQVRSSHGSPPD
jgi:hypothetical protein